jgi:hypothetical protein
MLIVLLAPWASLGLFSSRNSGRGFSLILALSACFWSSGLRVVLLFLFGELALGEKQSYFFAMDIRKAIIIAWKKSLRLILLYQRSPRNFRHTTRNLENAALASTELNS